jgi:solute carrier family 25 S-adenosylmethionine transporter 26
MVHMMSGGIGEIVACLVRVPTDVIKQRYQAKLIAKETPIASAAAAIYREHGLKGFYNGYFSTILREIPFSFIQFPLYEKMKRYIGKLKYDRFVAKSDGDILCNEPGNKDDLYLKQLSAIEAALCGSVSGAIAAALTTPLDVVKTRLMLGGVSPSFSFSSENCLIYFQSVRISMACHIEVLSIL